MSTFRPFRRWRSKMCCREVIKKKFFLQINFENFLLFCSPNVASIFTARNGRKNHCAGEECNRGENMKKYRGVLRWKYEKYLWQNAKNGFFTVNLRLHKLPSAKAGMAESTGHHRGARSEHFQNTRVSEWFVFLKDQRSLADFNSGFSIYFS